MTTLAGLPVLGAEVVMPLTGAWTADVSVSSDVANTGAVTLDDAGIHFTGTVVRGEVIAGRWHARLVGGKGGLGKVLEARAYRSIAAKAVVNDILTGAGEQLAPDSDATLLQTVLPNWQRERAAAGRSLTRVVVDELGANWRVKRDGTVWIGKDAYPEQKLTFQKLDADETTGVWIVATDRMEIQPGVSLQAHKVLRVVHRVDSASLRSEVWTGSAAKLSLFHRLIAELREAPYMRLWPASVLAQNDDGTLDLVTDDAEMRGTGLQHVPIRHGVPGIKVKVPAGARVRLCFDAGDPKRPFALLWDEGAVTEVKFDDGTKAVARIEDTTVGGELFYNKGTISGVDVVTAIFYRAAGETAWALVTNAVGPPATVPTALTPGTAIAGKITSGNSKLKA